MTSETELGMYAIANAKEGKLTIGKYELIKQSDGKIWIQSNDGAEFQEEKLELVIDKFYKENF